MNGHIEIEPMAAVRMTQNDKFKPSARRYLTYKNLMGNIFNNRMKRIPPLDAPVEVNLVFHISIPPSYSLKKRRELVGQPHTKKPDLDNLIKGFYDSANGILWIDDNRVCKCTATKVYATEPGVSWEVKPFEQTERVEPAVQQGAQGGVRRPKQSVQGSRATLRGTPNVRKAFRGS